MANKDVQPIYIMSEDTKRSQGKNAQRNNIMAGKLVAETIRTTLGPKGMDKMLVDSLGDVIVTNDGVTILKEMQIEHPAAKMVVEVAKTQEEEVGDGTTTAVVLAGELLKKSEDLLDQKIHPTIIVKGYRIAAEKSQIILNNFADEIKVDDIKALKDLASTAMTGKGADSHKDLLSDLTVEAVNYVFDEDFSMEKIKIQKNVGGAIEDSKLIKGIVVDKERVHNEMPTKIKKAKILLLNDSIEIKNTETEAKISINDPSQMQNFLDMEEKMIKSKVKKIVDSKANVVICQKGIDDLAQYLLAKKGVYAIRRAKKSDIEALAKATGASIVSNIESIEPKDLGKAGYVHEKKVGDEQMTFIEDCKNPKSVTLLLKGGTEHVVDEVKRAIEDAIGDVVSALKNKKVVAGAGAPEIELARNLRHYADSLSGREQLAINAFADAVEVIPKTLAENAGLDPIDVLTELKAAHDKGEKWAGIDVFSGKIINAWKEGIIEPLKIKTQAVSSATEVTNLILRIDDIIASGSSKPKGGGMPPQMPPGMGGGMY